MKTLKQIREASGGKEAYQKFFNSLLKKFGVSSPSELKGDKKKEFYDAIDAGWEGDNEKPEKNETYGDPDNLDPDTTTDPDEEEIKASYGKMNAGKMMASYHKENVNEALSKLIGKAGRGKLSPKDAIDIDYMGDRKDIKFDSTKWKINIKGSGNGQALVSGEKKKIIAWLTSDDYGMDDEDIEDLFPELMESRYPKPLSIIRQVKEFSGDAETVRRKKRRFEKMAMCEHCGKMHEEGACMETDNDLDPETKGMEEANRLSIKLKGDASKLFDLAKKQGIKNKAHGDKEWNKAVDQAAAEMGKKVNFKDIAAVKQAMMHESVKEAKTVKLNRPEKNIFDLAMKAIARSHDAAKARTKRGVEKYMDYEGMDLIDDITGVSLTDNEKNNVYNAVRDALNAKTRESVKEAKEAKLSPSMKNQIHKIAKKHSGDMEAAMKEISKMKVWKGKGIQDHSYVMDTLKTHNEDVNEGVAVDRRTKGFKDAMIRNEKAKKVREKAKKKKEAKKDQAELDARYDYDGEVDTVLAAANAVMNNTRLETAANAVAHGGVDMAPNAGKKKKDKEKIFARKY